MTNDFEMDIMRLLTKEGPLFSRTIRERLRQIDPTYKGSYSSDRSFDAVLSRKLRNLKDDDKLEQDDKRRYLIRGQAQASVNKTIFAHEIGKAISAGELHEVEISEQRINKIADTVKKEMVETEWFRRGREEDKETQRKKVEDAETNLRSMLRKDLTKKELKEARHAARAIAPFAVMFEEKKQVENEYKGIKDFGRLVKISVVSSKGEPTPILADGQLERLFQVLFYNLVNENTGKPRRSFHIIASFEFPQDQFDFISTHDLDKHPKKIGSDKSINLENSN